MLTLAVALVLHPRPAFSPASVKARVDAVVAKAMKRGPSAGIGVAVAMNGRIVYANGYGYANLENSAKATDQTVFHTCSIGKHFTASAILELARERKLSLADDLGRYIPAFSGRGITIKQMLSHTSGLGDFSTLPEFVAKERMDWPQKDVIALIAKQPLIFQPGTSWSYSNSAFYLLGAVIEKASGEPYYRFMQEHVWDPLGMHVYDGGSDAIIPHFAYGYDYRDGKPVKANPVSWQPVYSAGGMCCTPSDLVRFEMALESGRKLVPNEDVEEMRAPTSISREVTLDYGLGTRRGSLEGHPVFGHTGSGAGYSTVLMSFPRDHLTLAVMQNESSGMPSDVLGTQVARSLLGLGEDKPIDLQLTPEVSRLKFGIYRADSGDFDIFVREGRLRFRPAGSKGAGLVDKYQGGVTFSSGPDRRERLVVRGGDVPFIELYEGALLIDVARKIDGGQPSARH